MQKESQILRKYLIGESICDDLIKRYCDAISAQLNLTILIQEIALIQKEVGGNQQNKAI